MDLIPATTYGDGWADHDPPEYTDDGRLYVYRDGEVGLCTLTIGDAFPGPYVYADSPVQVIYRRDRYGRWHEAKGEV